MTTMTVLGVVVYYLYNGIKNPQHLYWTGAYLGFFNWVYRYVLTATAESFSANLRATAATVANFCESHYFADFAYFSIPKTYFRRITWLV
ncbi:MAG: hypothetical protein R2822_21705 [Spirosomataceae bacterium]